ncbi:DUF5025 domain-containing protein [Rufibacter tibetensis]|uniref:Lipoprotein n=1 Tax=Rufibacter tibetensis TaxID=512763 RepID=A0A0P0D1T6_9BACT|nr:DUF5025 domain-containing protein [Rufibacter tibetensis]ALJ01050.1 hypothetical protein DC20_21205 [Rufibacter tibetensis]
MKRRIQFVLPLLYGVFLLLVGCQQDDDAVDQTPEPVTSFSMQLNNQRWQPSQIGEDKCMQKFHGAWSYLGGKPYFTIVASRDAKMVDNTWSEEGLRLQIFDLTRVGVYPITNSYKEDFVSYVSLRVNTSGGAPKVYVNKTDKPAFWVEVKEFYDLPGFSQKGIKGTFYGTLYNEANPQDSVSFEKGEFLFKKVNWHNYNQCYN